MDKVRKSLSRLGTGAKKLYGRETVGFCCIQILILALFSTLVAESFSRFSVLKAVGFLFGHPLIFIANFLIVAATFTPALLFRRKPAVYALITILWITSGIIDFVVLHNRTTPFNGNDFHMLVDGWNVLFHYYNWAQVIGLFALILFGLLLITLGFIRFPKSQEKLNYKERVPFFLIAAMSCTLLVILARYTGIVATHFPNIANAYQEYGLPYCFTCSLLDKGISKPSNYSPDVIIDVIDKVEVTPAPTETNGTIDMSTHKDTNVIFIQLESFFDPKRIAGITFDQDPIPTFTYMKEHCTSGLLDVPSISAGTANTEFEILTGMNMNDFGTGEYPYKTILKTTPCESMAYNYKALGYKAHAIHNNIASFYNRDIVFSNLGFDVFDSLEMMHNVEYNELNWAKDKILFTEITDALHSTDGKDFIFTVSVQGHGSYPDEDIIDNTIELVDVDEAYSDNTIHGLKYYTSQLKEMDSFISELTGYFRNYNEDVVLVLYGDHLPGFGFTDNDLTYGNTLQTEYVIWSNFRMEREQKNLEAFELAAYVQERLGFSEGLITKLHQKRLTGGYEDEATYLEDLKLLSFDMLYGEHYCFNGEIPYAPTSLDFGYRKPHISTVSAIQSEDKAYLTINGDNFTSYTKIYINGTQQKGSIYVGKTQLFVADVSLTEGDVISVITLGSDSRELYASEPITFSSGNILNPQ